MQYRIDGYRMPAFYLFSTISMVISCNFPSKSTVILNRMLSKITIVCPKCVSWSSIQERHSTSTILYLILKLSYMINMRREGSVVEALLTTVRMSQKVTSYYIFRALLILK